MANINKTRHIQNNPSVNVNEFTYVMPQEVELETGIQSIVIGLDDIQNELEVELNFLFEEPKSTFINGGGYIKVNDIEIYSFLDLGVGLPVGGTISLGTEAETQKDYNAFLATLTVELAY